MILEKEQGELFYRLWLPLLSYANQKYHIVNDFAATAPSKGISPEKASKVANKIWEDISIIDEYIEVYSDEMSEEEINIVAGWKNAVRGTFVVDRHLKKGSILVSVDADKKVYLVKGICSDWREMLGNLPMPQMVDATLLPFQGMIIHDGLIRPYGICMGKRLADETKSIYLEAKAADKIFTHIEC